MADLDFETYFNYDGSETLVILKRNCVFTDKPFSVVITLEQYNRLNNGRPVTEVLEDLHPAIREFLITGISPNGWDEFQFELNVKNDLKKIDQKDLFERKVDYSFFKKRLEQFNINKLYHFTDEANLKSINNIGGLLSLRNCIDNGLIPRNFSSSDSSRETDKSLGLDNYIRLSFCRDHPMLYYSIKENRIKKPIIIEISKEVIYFEYTRFSNQNALKSSAKIGGDFECFKNINLNLFKGNYFSLEEIDRPYYQAEVLALESIPMKYILDINSF